MPLILPVWFTEIALVTGLLVARCRGFFERLELSTLSVYLRLLIGPAQGEQPNCGGSIGWSMALTELTIPFLKSRRLAA